MFTSRRIERSRETRRRLARAIVIVLVVGATGTGGWLWWRARAAAPASRRADAAADVTPGTPPSPTVASEAADLPGLDDSDAFVRPLVSALSSHPRVAAWMATDNLVHRFVLAVVDVAAGRSPEAALPFLRPGQAFKAREVGAQLQVDPSSYHRYDGMTATIVSLDTQGTARLFAKLEPLMEEAYRELGLRDQSFEEAVSRAFGRLLAVRFPDAPPSLEHNSVAYTFENPRLEALTPVAKHLLRVGPENGRRIQAKLQELASAMGVQPVAPGQDAP